MKIEYKMTDNKSTISCKNAKGKELLAAVNDFANCVGQIMKEPADKILYRAWLAQMSKNINGGKGYQSPERKTNESD